MKKFTRILICLMLCVFGFGLVACGDPRTEEEKNFTYPNYNAEVQGNGGLAVKKGNYVYFVNGYKSIKNVSDKNATHNVGSLMLMKLDENGEVVRDENGLLKDDYFISMSNKLCGYEATNLYVHGGYLYFVSPCLENESGNKVWAKERVVFNRIKLDKSSKVEEVYRSGVKVDQLKYEYYEENGNLYILTWEKGGSSYANNGTDALIRVNATNKSSQKIANHVSSVVFADEANEIFFAKHSNDDDYYFLKQYDIANNQTTEYDSFENSFEVKAVAGGKVFITTSHESASTTDIMVSNIEDKTGFELAYAYSDSLDIHVDIHGNLICVSGKTISLIKSDNDVETIVDDDASSIDVIGFINGCVLYYDNVSNIKLVSYSNVLLGYEAKIKTLTTIDAVEEDFAYFDLNEEESMLYFYKKVNENYYLHRIKVDYNFNVEEKEEMFGVYSQIDVPEIEEEVEEEIEE